MTHKNRDGTPISSELLKSLERSRPGSVKDTTSNSNHSDEISNEDAISGKDQNCSNSSGTVISPAKEHCLSLTIQHSHGENSNLPTKANSPPSVNGDSRSVVVAASINGTTPSPLRTANKKRTSSKISRLLSPVFCS